MRLRGCVLALVCSVSLTSALADTVIGPDTTVTVTNSEALGTDPVQLNEEQLAYVFSKRDDALAMLMVEPDTSEFQAKVVDARNKPKGRASAAAGKVATAGRRKAA